MKAIQTLIGALALSLSTPAQSEQLNFLIEPGSFRPGHFSSPVPLTQQVEAAQKKAEKMADNMLQGTASQTEKLEAEQAALYARMRRENQPDKRRHILTKLTAKSRELQSIYAVRTGEDFNPGQQSRAMAVKASYYAAAARKDPQSIAELKNAAETYQQTVKQLYNSGLADAVDILLAEITVEEATLMSNNGRNAEATQQKYDDLAKQLATRAANGAEASPAAAQAAIAAHTFAREWALHRKDKTAAIREQEQLCDLLRKLHLDYAQKRKNGSATEAEQKSITIQRKRELQRLRSMQK